MLPLALTLGLLGAPPVTADQLASGAKMSALAEAAPTDRGRVLNYWRDGGPGVKAAAEAALVGSDADLQAFLVATEELSVQDNRVRAAQLASLAGSELQAAARKALAGTPEELGDFLDYGWEDPLEQDQRIRAAQVVDAGGPVVQEAGRAALAGSAEDVAAFLKEGQYFQREQDERVQLAQVLSVGGTNVRSAGRLALSGNAADIREFLEVGQFVARAKDQEHDTVAQLAAQAKEAGRQAAKETEAAQIQSKKAIEAAELAKEAALRAAAEAEAAKDDTQKAARAAGRAAKAASQAAAAAQVAIDASRAANNSARVAANAASQAAAAAAGAAQAASRARSAAADAAVDQKNAGAARLAAQNARDAAKGADLAADASDQAAIAADAAGDAASSAASAGSNATLAADAAIEAGHHAGQSSAAAAEARAAAAQAKRHAAEANRAAAAAEVLARKAAKAAREARDAARSAAVHANNAAKAADEAADHAGEAAQAATRSTAHANAATEAANAASAAVVKAQQIYTIAREVEAGELLGRTNAGIEAARDDQQEHVDRLAQRADLDQGVKDREAERLRLLALADMPGADLAAVAAQGRQLAVLVMKNGTSWGRAAAEAALAGPDEVVIDYLRNGWNTAQAQDDRSYVERLAEESETKEVRDAAEEALNGDATAITAFVTDGQYQAGAQGMRVAIAQVISDAGPVLAEAGQKALSTNDPKKYSHFLLTTQPTARTQDERVRAAQLIDSGSPELKSAARAALEGSPQTLHAFIVSGQFKAQRKDHLNATHIAQVQKLIADAAKVAATAQQNAATAQKVAALARKAAAEADLWAKKAGESATNARNYADQAAQHAKNAEASAASAAASARTARDAADSADLAASDAARSATDATLSSETAQAEAAGAWYAADQARASAIAAGKDAEAALKASTEAFTVAVRKHKEEAEARRKAAVEAKERAKNDEGARAREMYRCGQGYIPCDPQGFARWCQHNEIYCGILSKGDEFGSAMDELLQFGKEIAGLSNLEKCMESKDFENCWELGTDVLIGAKLKALDKAFDALKMLRLGCTRCFLAGTGVLMGDGSVKNIEDVRLGDTVLAADPEIGETGPRKVTRLIRTDDDKHFNTLSIATANGVEQLTATHEHPFWSPSERGWVAARDLAPEMTLLTDVGETVIVTGNKGFTKRARTYNLTVDDLHTYYVLAGATPVLVHNSNGVCGVWVGEFDNLPKGRQGHVREMADEQAMRTAFDRWTAGAEKLPARGPKIPDVYRLEDGTVIQWRTASASGGATIDIQPGSGGKALKVHMP